MNQMVHKKDGRKTRHEARRGELLSEAAKYVLEHGLTGLSIRPLAAALGLSHRALLYHFGTRENLIIEVLDLIRANDKVMIRAHLQKTDITAPSDLFRAAWAYFIAEDRLPYIRLFHEAFMLGLTGPPYDAWVESMVGSRTQMIAMALKAIGCPDERAKPAANLVIASIRGLQLHLLASGDREATDAAFEELLRAMSVQLPGFEAPPA